MTELQSTTEWRKSRVGKITASRVGGILGAGDRMGREDVMRQMVREHHGAEDEISSFVRILMQHGKDSEAGALVEIQAKMGVFIDESGFIRHEKLDWIGCSPDGLIGEDAGVEVKCPTKHRRSLQDVLDDEGYRCQCLLSLIVTGREQWHFFVYREGDELLHKVFYLKEAEDWFSENMDDLLAFNQEYLKTISSAELSEPHLCDLEAVRDDVEWTAETAQYLEALARLEEAKADVAFFKSNLVEMTNGRKSRGGGVVVYPVKGRKSTNYAKAVKDMGVDVSQYVTAGEPTWVVKVSSQGGSLPIV